MSTPDRIIVAHLSDADVFIITESGSNSITFTPGQWAELGARFASATRAKLRKAAMDEADMIEDTGPSDLDKLCAGTLRHFADLHLAPEIQGS